MRAGWLLRIAAGVLVLVFLGLAIASQWEDTKAIDWSFRPGWLVVSLLTLAAVQPLQAELWRRLVHALGSGLPVRRGIAIWNVSVLGRYVPTSAMMAVARVQMSGEAGVPRRVVAASMVYEVALLVGSAMLVAAAFVIDLPQLEGEPLRYAVGPLSLLGIAALHPRVLRPVTDRLLTRAGREPLPVVLPFGTVALFAAGYLVTLVLAGVSTYALVEALTPVGSDALLTGIGAFAVGFAASGVAFVLPAGIGAKEGAMAAALTPVAPLAVGTAVAVAQRLAQTLLEVGWAAVSARAARRDRPGAALPTFDAPPPG